jgi:hypothetical protein
MKEIVIGLMMILIVRVALIVGHFYALVVMIDSRTMTMPVMMILYSVRDVTKIIIQVVMGVEVLSPLTMPTETKMTSTVMPRTVTVVIRNMEILDTLNAIATSPILYSTVTVDVTWEWS